MNSFSVLDLFDEPVRFIDKLFLIIDTLINNPGTPYTRKDRCWMRGFAHYYSDEHQDTNQVDKRDFIEGLEVTTDRPKKPEPKPLKTVQVFEGNGDSSHSVHQIICDQVNRLDETIGEEERFHLLSPNEESIKILTKLKPGRASFELHALMSDPRRQIFYNRTIIEIFKKDKDESWREGWVIRLEVEPLVGHKGHHQFSP